VIFLPVGIGLVIGLVWLICVGRVSAFSTIALAWSSCAELAPSPVPLLMALPPLLPLSSPPQPAATTMMTAIATSSAMAPRRLTGADRPSLGDMVLFLLILMNRVIASCTGPRFAPCRLARAARRTKLNSDEPRIGFVERTSQGLV
jgi:hypothetical protein